MASFMHGWPARNAQGKVVIVTAACSGCGTIFAPRDAGRLEPNHRARLAAREQLGRAGDWDSLGLPSFQRIGLTAGDSKNITTIPKSARFFKYDWEYLAEPDLFGTVRSRLGLARSLWPRAVVSPAWERPVILHHGLVEKFTAKRDNSHLHLVSMTQRTVEQPVEAWIDEYGGSLNLHLLARYGVPQHVITQLVCVDTRTAICTTAYQLMPGAEDRKRKGLFQYARWVADR